MKDIVLEDLIAACKQAREAIRYFDEISDEDLTEPLTSAMLDSISGLMDAKRTIDGILGD